ncbi:MAG: ATP-binding protein [Rhizobiaceae bacterium]|nr:ATP-binding protein [Rhizobiaceae bacterium]
MTDEANKPKVETKGHGLDGYDPLSIALSDTEEKARLLEEQTKRFIQSILKSYTGFYDIFSELTQNAIDALERRLEHEEFDPKIWVTIDIDNSLVRVVDNGIGMDSDEFRSFLAPAVSFKTGWHSRGHKGVGATFLAYGFSYIGVHTRRSGNELAAVLRQGRQWAEDASGTIQRPRFEGKKFSVPELETEPSGTAFEIIVGKSVGERPKDLSWIGATTPEQWFDVLRIKTPIGGIYLDEKKFEFSAIVSVVYNGKKDKKIFSASEYYYPHEMPDQKVASINEISAALNKIDGDSTTKFSKLPGEYKRLDAIYEVWTDEQLVSENSPFESALNEELLTLIRKHRAALYVCFLRSAKIWASFNNETLKLRKGIKVIQGGLQLATDSMVQGDLSVIPLTSAIGYQANSHVIVHFHDGNPDMGRKTFQPELKDLADTLAVRAVNICKRYLTHLKPDTGNVSSSPKKALYDWKKAQEQYRDQNPLSLVQDEKSLSIVSVPQQEQDVVALFHELVGLGYIRGLSFYATSSHETYDSLFFYDYDDRERFGFRRMENPLGVFEEFAVNNTSEPKILEYKYDFDSLVDDFEKEVKFDDGIDFVVCWDAGPKYREKYYLNSLLVGDEGTAREIYGATHQAFRDGSSTSVFEVLVLKDLISFLHDRDAEEARQKVRYKD